MDRLSTEQLPEFARIRLFVPDDLSVGGRIRLSPDQGHYLHTVMRLPEGGEVRLFNGRDGEWAARLSTEGKSLIATTAQQLRAQDAVEDIRLAFAPIKKSPMEYLVEKATELGVKSLSPVITERTQIRQVNVERMHAQAIEAAEQSWRLSVPEIQSLRPVFSLLDVPASGRVLFCDERSAMRVSKSALATLNDYRGERIPWTILIGPEGGFSPAEQERIEAMQNIVPISLGPRIVRAETAAVMALTLWQSVLGDLKLLVE